MLMTEPYRKIPITQLSRAELEAVLVEWGERPFRVKQILKWVYEKRIESFEEMTDLGPSLREALAANYSLGEMELVRRQGSEDTTQKLLFRLSDKRLIECVLIPASIAFDGERSDRQTLCVSSQVGCAYDCKFCASGLAGFTRNLTSSEIVEQVMQTEALSGKRVNNLVFMGMGEPLANLTNLLRATEIINEPWGIGIGARHLTVSTSGLAPQIMKLADQPLQLRLAVSLHGATDEVRDRRAGFIVQRHPLARGLPEQAAVDAPSDRAAQQVKLDAIVGKLTSRNRRSWSRLDRREVRIEHDRLNRPAGIAFGVTDPPNRTDRHRVLRALAVAKAELGARFIDRAAAAHARFEGVVVASLA